jgi:flagellar motility protein MotE (MotC chaperone)
MKFTKKKIIILISVSVSMLLLGGIGFYLLYPKMNPEKYEETVQQVEVANALNATLNTSESESSYLENNIDATDSESRKMLVETQKVQIDSLKSIIRELESFRDELNTEKTDLSEKIKKLEEQANQKATFQEELKGILSLDDKQLSPILEKMNDMKVADIYQGSTVNQKQKILRCLDPVKAAKLLEAVIK